jgi:hypothetical protein
MRTVILFTNGGGVKIMAIIVGRQEERNNIPRVWGEPKG